MNKNNPAPLTRRTGLKQTFVLSALAITRFAGVALPSVSFAATLSKEERDALTLNQVIERFKEDNLRFRENRPLPHDYLAQKRSSIEGQYPAAVILNCIDSRAPAEILLDAELGHLTGLLEEIKPAISKTEYTGERKGSNYDFVDAVARKNVELTMENIRKNSPVMNGLEVKKKIKVVGSMYHLSVATNDFLEV